MTGSLEDWQRTFKTEASGWPRTSVSLWNEHHRHYGLGRDGRQRHSARFFIGNYPNSQVSRSQNLPEGNVKFRPARPAPQGDTTKGTLLKSTHPRCRTNYCVGSANVNSSQTRQPRETHGLDSLLTILPQYRHQVGITRELEACECRRTRQACNVVAQRRVGGNLFPFEMLREIRRPNRDRSVRPANWHRFCHSISPQTIFPEIRMSFILT